MSGVFTIAPGADFAANLAEGLIARCRAAPLALSDAIIYLPTRRAARSFGDSFLKALGGAALLPQLRALGDADEDDLLFDAASEVLELPPAIAPIRRQLLLANMIRRWDARARRGDLSFAQASALAAGLAQLMDEIETQNADLNRLEELAPLALAEHWAGVTDFLALLREEWPGLLAAEGAINPMARRNAVMQALTARLQASPPPGMVIAAGSTGSIPATADFLKAVAGLPHGAVVLPGLDRVLPEDAWQELDPSHPQYGLKQLLGRIGADRRAVPDWFETSHAGNPARESLLRETLRPAPTTDAWRALADNGDTDMAAGLKGLAYIEAATPADEAIAIAIALRETLKTSGRTAALVTPDRNLARRVAAELRRWNIAVDDSAGRPLAHTGAGAFLCLLAEAAGSLFAPVPLLALLKHPFATLGRDGASFRARARDLDRRLRGPRPDAGLAGITRAIAATPDHAALADWWRGVVDILEPLEKLFAHGDATLARLVESHGAAAMALACDEAQECILWRNDDGEAAADLFAALILAVEDLPPVESRSYPALFRALAMQCPVRTAFGRHPRLAILGAQEARLQRFDLTILGGLNEGSWPGTVSADPWFSRPMRDVLGLERPERGIGLAAHDFATLAAGPDVLLTRAQKADGAPTIASRWLQRLSQLTGGLNLTVPQKNYAQWAARMMEVEKQPPFPRPAARPPVAARPRRLSVTEIETWLRDPYAIYARHVLKLKPWDMLDKPIGPKERGIALHQAMEFFIRKYPGGLPHDAALELSTIADKAFDDAGIPRSALAVWRPRFFDAAQGFVAFERTRQDGIAASHLEVRGTRRFDAPGGDFLLSGVADRIDEMKDGSLAILDYKSGAVPSGPQVQKLLSPQLPLEAAILAAGGFAGLGAQTAEALVYLSLADGEKASHPVIVKNAIALTAQAVEQLTQRIARFDEQQTAYYSRVRPFQTDSVGDYDHLARVREWSAEAQ